MPESRAVVLVVDDELDLCEMLALNLNNTGYRAVAATTVSEALDLLATENVAVVLADVRMPAPGGFHLLDQIKSVNVFEPAVVLISAYPELTPFEAHHAGADAVLTKPFRLARLEGILQRLLLPLRERWVQPPERHPVYELQVFAPPTQQDGEGLPVVLGRGGAFIDLSKAESSFPSSGPIPGQQLAFSLGVAGEPSINVVGSGTVRWVTTPEDGVGPTACGVEFDYLEPESLAFFLRWLDEIKPRPFIP